MSATATVDLGASRAWAASGAMALTGAASGPPARLVDHVALLGASIVRSTEGLEGGSRVELDWLALLGERAALAGLPPSSDRSCGGATRLLPVGSGWVAVALARPDDGDLLPAWLGVDPGAVAWPPTPSLWSEVADRLAGSDTTRVVEDGARLGLAVAVLGERVHDDGAGVRRLPARRPDRGRRRGPDRLGRAERRPPRVLDLSALWAGPLCTSLLGLAGADVVAVESPHRPDPSRTSHPRHHSLLRAGTRTIEVDLRTTSGRRRLAELVRRSDVVVEASRPRALEQAGIVALDVLAADEAPTVWVSITGHGRDRNRIAFGDDAAVAGGLVCWTDGRPVFCADAVADPLTGLAAAAAALEAWVRGERVLLDVAMSGVAAAAAGPTLPPSTDPPAPPRARR